MNVINKRGFKSLFMLLDLPFVNSIKEHWSKLEKNIKINSLNRADTLRHRSGILNPHKFIHFSKAKPLKKSDAAKIEDCKCLTPSCCIHQIFTVVTPHIYPGRILIY